MSIKEELKVVFERENGKCYWCGKKVAINWDEARSNWKGTCYFKNGQQLDAEDNGERDHIIPRLYGENWVTVLSCHKCNCKKGCKVWIKDKKGNVIILGSRPSKVIKNLTLSRNKKVLKATIELHFL